MVSIRSETAIERSQATTQRFIMSHFEQLTANFGLPHGEPPHPPTADSGAYSRSDIHNTHVYEPNPHIFDEEHPRHGKLDDISLRRFLRAHGPTFTTEITFSEFRRDYINDLRAINNFFPERLEGARRPPAAQRRRPRKGVAFAGPSAPTSTSTRWALVTP
jgi:hypothetical protein